MKILYVTNMYPTPNFIYNGIHVQEQISFLTSKYKPEFQVEFIDGSKSKLNYIKSIIKINHIIRKNDFDIVHIHFGLSGLFLLFNLSSKIPAVVTLHGSDTKRGKAYGLMLPITKRVVKRSNKVIIMNDRMKNLFRNHSNKLVKIPCGIDIKTFDVGRNNTSEIFKIGFAGSKNRPGKNYVLFKEIVEHIKAEDFQVEMIEFHNMTREEVIQNLSSLDCLLMTSLYEGSPQIIKEAMASGVPIISTNVGDVKYTLFNVENCYVIDSFYADSFIEPLKKILKLKNEERKTNGKSKLLELQLDQDSVVAKIYNVYNDIIISHEKEN